MRPLVLYIPKEFNERTYKKQLQAFDPAGHEHLLDAKKAPDYPVIVVGPSERVSSAMLESFKTPDDLVLSGKPPDGTDNLLKQDDDNGGTGGYTPPLPTPPAYSTGTYRKDRQTEYLTSLWMADVSEFESWFLGDPEICLRIKSPKFASSSSGNLVETMGWSS